MTQVDFYILKNSPDNNLALLVCKLVDKAYQRGHKVYVNTVSAEQSQQIDDLLWSFREGSFIPHGQLPAEDPQTPVLIGHELEPPLECDVLVNLAKEVPLFFSRFPRVAEIVGSEETQKQQARERFRFYRDRGYTLNSHDITL